MPALLELNTFGEAYLYINCEQSEIVGLNAEESFALFGISRCNYLFISSPMEIYDNETLAQLDNTFHSYKSFTGHKVKIILLLGEQYRYNNGIYKFKNIDAVYYIDFFAYELYAITYIKKWQPLNDTYEKSKFENDYLLLINKPDKPNRAPLVYKLWQQNLLKNACYSFNIKNSIEYESCYDLIRNYTSDEVDRRMFRRFVKETKSEIDKTREYVSRKSSDIKNFYVGLPFDPNIFSRSKFQVVSETKWRNEPEMFITEKTYLAILNNMPFYLLANDSAYKLLRSYGFKTFQQYHKPLRKPKGISQASDWTNLNIAVENIAYWKENIHKWYKDLQILTQHNKQRFLSIAKKQEQEFKKILETYNISVDVIDFFNNGYYLNSFLSDIYYPKKNVKIYDTQIKRSRLHI